jgi:rhodanese-related sulfurtransferase
MSTRLIDVRQYPEFAAAHIAGSELAPLHTLSRTSAAWDHRDAITLVCKSGRRAAQAREQLAGLGFTNLAILEGGIDAWAAAGRPLVSLAKKPWSMERQVRVAAGSLVLITLALAFTASRYFFIGTAFVGASLVFAGVTDICMMASLLGRLPWNRAQSQP